MRRFALSAALLLVGGAASADPPGNAAAHARAGYPQEVSRFARPSDTGRYVGYPVGGGCAFPRKGDPPGPNDGTWGWDYLGGCFQRRVILHWWHGRRYQGGAGAYETEGPRVLHPIDEKH